MQVYKVVSSSSSSARMIDEDTVIPFESILSEMMNELEITDRIPPVPQICCIASYPTIIKNDEMKEIKNDE